MAIDISKDRHVPEFHHYGFDKCPNNFFTDFVDIGGCYGTISFMISQRHPNCNIFCYEPSEEEFKIISERAKEFSNVTPINEALGDGNDLIFNRKQVGRHLFLKTGDGYKKKSKTLKEIFDDNKIDIYKSNYGLKIDCEGGERFLLIEKSATEIIKNSSHFAMEIHFNNKEGLMKHKWFRIFPFFQTYNNWINNNFCDTHNMIYWKSTRRAGLGIYILINKRNNYGEYLNITGRMGNYLNG